MEIRRPVGVYVGVNVTLSRPTPYPDGTLAELGADIASAIGRTHLCAEDPVTRFDRGLPTDDAAYIILRKRVGSCLTAACGQGLVERRGVAGAWQRYALT